MAGSAILVVLLLGFAFTVGLYLLIAAETSNPRVVDRETATREARARGGLGSRAGATAGEDRADHEEPADDDRFGWIDEDDDRRRKGDR